MMLQNSLFSFPKVFPTSSKKGAILHHFDVLVIRHALSSWLWRGVMSVCVSLFSFLSGVKCFVRFSFSQWCFKEVLLSFSERFSDFFEKMISPHLFDVLVTRHAKWTAKRVRHGLLRITQSFGPDLWSKRRKEEGKMDEIRKVTHRWSFLAR